MTSPHSFSSGSSAKPWLRFLFILLNLAFVISLQAQWKSETYNLKGGWNSIYLHGDATHATPDVLFASNTEVEEVWRWNPNPTPVQFTTTPLIPSAGTPEWSVWKRDGALATLSELVGQSAYLVKCSGTSADSYNVTLKQRPMPPSNTWMRSGANLLGFPSFKNGANYPSFSNYFATFPAAIAANTKIFKYVGGDLGPSNPLQVFSPNFEKLDRNAAYWFSSEVVGNFYAPLELSLSTGGGLDFGRTGSTVTLRIRNRTAAVVTVTVTPEVSEAAPANETIITAAVPLTLRDSVAFTEAPVSGAITEVVQPGGKVELNFGVDRSAMTGASGALYASLLRVHDSSNLMDVYLPVEAVKGVFAGLWAGDVTVNHVDSRVAADGRATAKAVVNGSGVVTAITVQNGGSGYPGSTVTVSSTAGLASGTAVTGPGIVGTVTIAKILDETHLMLSEGIASATADLDYGGTVLGSVIVAPVPPTVTIAAPGAGGTQATATATVSDGSVTGFTINNPGSGYPEDGPQVTIASASPGTVPRPFPLRTLLHVADDGTASLLSKVFLGTLAGEGNPVGLCTQEAGLAPEEKASALRMAVAHLPLDRTIDDTSPGENSGSVALGGTLVRTVVIPHNDPTNPFIHQYHPDHDSRDARPDGTNVPLADGIESYSVTRTCTFSFSPSAPVGQSASGWGASVIGGQYTEIFRGLHRDVLTVSGTFILRRVSEIGSLTINN